MHCGVAGVAEQWDSDKQSSISLKRQRQKHQTKVWWSLMHITFQFHLFVCFRAKNRTQGLTIVSQDLCHRTHPWPLNGFLKEDLGRVQSLALRAVNLSMISVP